MAMGANYGPKVDQLKESKKWQESDTGKRIGGGGLVAVVVVVAYVLFAVVAVHAGPGNPVQDGLAGGCNETK